MLAFVGKKYSFSCCWNKTAHYYSNIVLFRWILSHETRIRMFCGYFTIKHTMVPLIFFGFLVPTFYLYHLSRIWRKSFFFHVYTGTSFCGSTWISTLIKMILYAKKRYDIRIKLPKNLIEWNKKKSKFFKTF